MSIQDLAEALRLIEESSDADFHGPQSDALIGRAEGALGLRFPPTYREFLKRLGCGHVTGCEFYGVLHADFANSGIPDAIWLTLDERRTADAPLALILVSDTGDGGYYAIDTSKRTPEGDCPVVVWWPGTDVSDANLEVVAEDFGAFLLENVQSATNENEQD